VAQAFDTAVANGYDANPFFALYNQGPGLNNALLQLSGELHSAERRVLMEDTRFVREAAFDRLNAGLSAIAGNQEVSNEVAGGDISFWLRGMGAWGNASPDDIGSSFNTQSWGVLTGVDYARDGYKVGAMFFYTSTDIDYIQLGQSTVETTGGAIYGGYRSDKGWSVGLGGAYAGNNADGTRVITASGLQQTLQSSVGGTSYQVFGEIAYDLMAAPNTRAEPFFRVAYAGVDSDEFREVGGIAAIEAANQSNDVTLLTLGLRGAWEQAGFRASASAGWQYATGDLSGIVESSIIGLDTPMFIQATALDQNSAALEFEASYGFTSAVRLGIGYSGIIGQNNANNSLRGTLSVAF
jgi:outer membrane autotransporter protein